MVHVLEILCWFAGLRLCKLLVEANGDEIASELVTGVLLPLGATVLLLAAAVLAVVCWLAARLRARRTSRPIRAH